jgi:hypothetical protein
MVTYREKRPGSGYKVGMTVENGISMPPAVKADLEEHVKLYCADHLATRWVPRAKAEKVLQHPRLRLIADVNYVYMIMSALQERHFTDIIIIGPKVKKELSILLEYLNAVPTNVTCYRPVHYNIPAETSHELPQRLTPEAAARITILAEEFNLRSVNRGIPLYQPETTLIIGADIFYYTAEAILQAAGLGYQAAVTFSVYCRTEGTWSYPDDEGYFKTYLDRGNRPGKKTNYGRWKVINAPKHNDRPYAHDFPMKYGLSPSNPISFARTVSYPNGLPKQRVACDSKIHRIIVPGCVALVGYRIVRHTNTQMPTEHLMEDTKQTIEIES